MHNEQFQQLQHCSPEIIRMRELGNVASIRGQRNTHRILVKKLEGKTLLGTRWHRWEHNTEIDIKRYVMRGREMDLSGSL